MPRKKKNKSQKAYNRLLAVLNEVGNLAADDDISSHLSKFQCILQGRRPNLAAFTSNDDGETILHKACKLGPFSFDFVRMLVEEGHGMDVNCLDRSGTTPLHALASLPNGVSYESFYFLVKKGAKLDLRNNDGRTPFDLISQYDSSKQDVILRSYAKQIFQQFKQNALLWTLKKAFYMTDCNKFALQLPIGKLSLEQFKQLLSFLLDRQQRDLPANESMLAVRDAEGEGDLPLHVAVRFGQSNVASILTDFIVEKYPEATNIQNKNGDLPIHIALQRFGTVKFFDRSFCAAWATVPNNNGDLPIHMFLHHFIAVHKPRFCTPPETKCDLLPLQLSLRRGAEVSMERDLSELLGPSDENAATLLAANAQARLPMHLACSGGVSRGILEMLLSTERKLEGSEGDQQPRSLSTPDENGFLPLHALCDSGAASIDALQCLIRAHPGSLCQARDPYSDHATDYPLALACPTATLGVVYTLLRANPAVLPQPAI